MPLNEILILMHDLRRGKGRLQREKVLPYGCMLWEKTDCISIRYVLYKVYAEPYILVYTGVQIGRDVCVCLRRYGQGAVAGVLWKEERGAGAGYIQIW